MKAIDSNLLVYASLVGHPAATACEHFIGSYPDWLTNIVNLVELHRVLISVYGVEEGDADSKFADFCDALAVETLSVEAASAAHPLRHTYDIDFNDAVLLHTCRKHAVGVLATDDSKLATACAALDISPENPIDPTIGHQMAQWEKQHLPSKGLPRVLLRVHQWLEQRDPTLAAEFHSETQALSRLI